MSKDEQSEAAPTVLTIGHSTRTIEEFIHLLKTHGATRVLDVRTVPRSRRNPQFNLDILPASLKDVGIAYTHVPALGGLRRPRPENCSAPKADLHLQPGACAPRKLAGLGPGAVSATQQKVAFPEQ